MRALPLPMIFGLIIFLALSIRLCGLDFDSLWLDEGYQSLVSASGQGQPDLTGIKTEPFLFRFGEARSLSELLKHFREVDPLCPPLYPCLLNRWMHAFGDTDQVLRSLSVLFSVASIGALFLFCRKLFNEPVAIAACLLQAISPFDVHYAQEARMYSLVVLTSVLSCGSLIRLLLRKEVFACRVFLFIIYIISSWALINSHYTGLFLIAAQGLLTLAYVITKRDWKLLAGLCLSWLAIILLWLPWLPLFLQAASIRKESFYVARTFSWLWPFYALFVRIPVNWECFLSGQRVVAYAAPLYLSSAAMLIYAALDTAKPRQDQTESSKFANYALWLWAIVPAGGLWLIDVMENHRVVEVARYTIFTAPAIYILAGIGITRIRQQLRWGSGLALTHLLFAVVNLIYCHTTHQKEPWRELAAEIESRSPANQLILVSQFYDIALLDRYLSVPRRQIGVSPAMGTAEIEKRLAGIESFTLVTAQDGEPLKNMLPARYKLNQEINMSHGIHLRFYLSHP